MFQKIQDVLNLSKQITNNLDLLREWCEPTRIILIIFKTDFNFNIIFKMIVILKVYISMVTCAQFGSLWLFYISSLTYCFQNSKESYRTFTLFHIWF